MGMVVGFVGLGAIGKQAASNLLRKGFPLVVYDVRAEPLAEMAGMGARAATSCAHLAREADVIVVMVLNHDQALSALEGEEGLLSGLGPGKSVIVTSTISPVQSRDLKARITTTGAGYLESPVSGGYLRAADGTLSLLVSGEEATMNACRPVLEAMGERIYYAGAEAGAGELLKIINNMLLCVQQVAAAEAMLLAVKSGVDPQLVYDVVCHSTGDSWAFRNRMDRLMARDFENKGALEILHKDLGFALDAGRDTETPLLLAATAYQVYQAAMVQGLAREDDSAVGKVLEGLAGAQVQAAT